MNCVVFFATFGRTLNGCNRLPAASVDCVKGEPKHRYAKSRTYYYDICLYNNGTIYLQNIQTTFVINLIILCSNVCKSPYW